jgi:hypothetical protein
MNVTDILDRLPFELAARLESDPFFCDIPIVVTVKGNVASEYERLQAVIAEKSGKHGVAVFVLQIIADDIYQGIPNGPMKLSPALQVIEHVEANVSENGTKKSCRKVARHIIKNMKLAGFRGIVQGFKCAQPAIVPADIKELNDACVAEQVNFECQEFSDEQFQYCQPPLCSQVPGQLQVALATGTAGASIWFTTDDSFPYPGDASLFPGSTSQLYSAPINGVLNTPQTIRACAYLPPYIASSIERFTVILTSQ